MERTRKQNLKIYFEYKHICYTSCVKYALFTCLTTVQIFPKPQKTFLTMDSDYTKIIVNILCDTTDSVTIKVSNQWVSDTSVQWLVDGASVKGGDAPTLVSAVFGAASSGCVSCKMLLQLNSTWPICLAQKAGRGKGECLKVEVTEERGVCVCVCRRVIGCVLFVVKTVCLVLGSISKNSDLMWQCRDP